MTELKQSFYYLIKVNQLTDGDEQRRETRPYLVRAIDLLTAQEAIHKHLAADAIHDYTIEAITKPRISNIHADGSAGVFYKAVFDTPIEDGKYARQRVIVEAEAFDDAYSALHYIADGSVVESLSLTNIAAFVDTEPF